MDTYIEFTSLLNGPEDLQTSSNDLFGSSLSRDFDIPVNAEMDGGGLGHSLCIIS